jgi:hypothetical protein
METSRCLQGREQPWAPNQAAVHAARAESGCLQGRQRGAPTGGILAPGALENVGERQRYVDRCAALLQRGGSGAARQGLGSSRAPPPRWSTQPALAAALPSAAAHSGAADDDVWLGDGQGSSEEICAGREENDAAVVALVSGIKGGLQRRRVVCHAVAQGTEIAGVESDWRRGERHLPACSRSKRVSWSPAAERGARTAEPWAAWFTHVARLAPIQAPARRQLGQRRQEGRRLAAA